ncbi:MAG: YSC84-related protein [Parvularculaceae bacterium]
MTYVKSAIALLVAAMLIFSGAAEAASKAKIDRKVNNALGEFREDIKGADALLNKANGVLVFPSVKKAGFVVGGEGGRGALRVGNKSVAYYATGAASIGFQFGARARRIIFVFLEQSALDKFRASENWEIGVDASVAVVTLDAGGAIDATKINKPIVAFIFDAKGLMYNLSLEGSKIERIYPD